MENDSFLKQIKDKGNGQAVIYIDKRFLDIHNLEVGDVVRIQKKS